MTETVASNRSLLQPVYRSPAAAEFFQQLYARALAALPFPQEERLVQTPSFGSAHVVVCGPPTAPPLLLWHGTAAPAPFMLASMQPIVERFRVYVPDIPCEAGSRSEEVVLDPASHGYGHWCLEVVQALGLLPSSAAGPADAAGSVRPPLHVGVSMGGCALLDLAVVAPEAIGGAVLIVPGSIHPGYGGWQRQLTLMARLLLPFALYRLLPCRWTAWLALVGMCDDPLREDLALENVKLAFRYVNYFPAGPGKLTDEQLARLVVPTLVVCAERDIFGPGAATAERARETIPQCEAVVLSGMKHLPSTARMQEINSRVIRFFEESMLASGIDMQGAPSAKPA